MIVLQFLALTLFPKLQDINMSICRCNPCNGFFMSGGYSRLYPPLNSGSLTVLGGIYYGFTDF